jgi:hypothetical protein
MGRGSEAGDQQHAVVGTAQEASKHHQLAPTRQRRIGGHSRPPVAR